jgi:hypothetical protein
MQLSIRKPASVIRSRGNNVEDRFPVCIMCDRPRARAVIATPVPLGTLVEQYHPGDVVSLTWTARRGATRTTQITPGAGPVR